MARAQPKIPGNPMGNYLLWSTWSCFPPQRSSCSPRPHCYQLRSFCAAWAPAISFPPVSPPDYIPLFPLRYKPDCFCPYLSKMMMMILHCFRQETWRFRRHKSSIIHSLLYALGKLHLSSVGIYHLLSPLKLLFLRFPGFSDATIVVLHVFRLVATFFSHDVLILHT